MAFNYNRGEWVAFDPDSKEPITSKQTLDKMLKNNCRFEACISQSTVVDSMAFSVVFIKSDEQGIILDREKREEISGMSLGGIIKFLEANSLMQPSMLDLLKEYNKERISIVHHTVRGKITVDFLDFYKLGEQLITELNSIFQDMLTRKGIDHKW